MANLNKIIEAAGGASELTQMLDPRERQGFEDFCKRTNPHYHPTDDSVIDRAAWRIWREACAWQRENAAVAIEENCHMFFTDKGCASLAKVVREQIRP